MLLRYAFVVGAKVGSRSKDCRLNFKVNQVARPKWQRLNILSQTPYAGSFSLSFFSIDSCSPSSDSSGKRYQSLCGETVPQLGHCVLCQWVPQPGHTPAVQKVCHQVPQLGIHHHRSSGLGRYSHFGHRISGSFAIGFDYAWLILF
jgi:hypothetical protein